MSREAYITGLGVVSPIGVGKEALLAGLRSGRSGLGPLRGIDRSEFRIGLGGEIDGEAGWHEELLDEGRCLAFALRACREALADAGLAGDPLPQGTALTLGSGAGEMRATETTMGPPEGALLLEHPDPVQPPSTVTSKLALHLGVHGRMLTFVNACAAGAQAVAVAADLVRNGRTDVAIAGGVEILSRMVLSGFEALRAVSPTACRPFDADRNGIQLAEMAAFVVLEPAERVSDRGVQAYARVAGSGSSADAFHPVRPDEAGAGAVLALRRALEDAKLSPDEIDYISGHGTGTAQNDPMELQALAEVFGPLASGIPISSTKAMLGHALGASGAGELVICALALRERFLPPTVGWERPIPGFEGFDIVGSEAREGVRLRNVISSAFAFGGNNVVLVLSAPDAIPPG